MGRYRDRARLAIAALDRVRAAKQAASPNLIEVERVRPDVQADLGPPSQDDVSIGSLVLYRPPGDKRAYPCRVQRVDGSRVYLVPELPTCTGWVDLETLSPPATQ
jgi:hypothetical protein